MKTGCVWRVKHFVLRQTSLLVWDGDLIRVARGLVLGRHVQDAFRNDIESNINLRHTMWYFIEMELPKQIGVLCQRSIPSKT